MRPSRAHWLVQAAGKGAGTWTTLVHPANYREAVQAAERFTSRTRREARVMLGGIEYYRTATRRGYVETR